MKIKIEQFKFMGATTLLLATLFLEASCNGHNKSDSKTEVKAPKADIHTAIITDNIDALRQHIAAGSDINVKEQLGGSTPLISAALFGKTEMAKILINAGAKPNIQNNDGSTALIKASFFCRPEIVKMLLDKGADKNIKNKYGQTAYETVSGPFAEVKSTYQGLGAMLEPMGLKLDFKYIEKTRPQIASILK